ncbi:MAG: hypothetical protein J6V81_02675 [Bacteroidales bacterium]|nr:hypothetical protein [Bacteroidales bacterium]
MRKIFLLLSISAVCLLSYAQQSALDFLQRYNTLVGRVGPDGVGVETLLENWEEAYPEDLDMLKAKWKYYFTKAQSTTLEMMDREKYLGEAPALSLKDSLGNNVNYFQKTVFDDEMFGQATQALEKATKIAPDDLELHFGKITGLLTYEGESPDMAKAAIRSLIDYNYLSKPSWTFAGEPATQADFEDAIQEYCFTFYQIGSPASFEAFREIAQKMIDYKCKNVVFQNDVATYYQVYKDNPKEALKLYNKVLKAVPDDYTAIKNSVLIARKTGNKKNEKKYLAMLAKYAPTEIERTQAQTRLSSLK